jgi:hypothetical protein
VCFVVRVLKASTTEGREFHRGRFLKWICCRSTS